MNTLKNCCYLKIALSVIFMVLGSGDRSGSLQAQLANVTIDIPAPHGGTLGTAAVGFAFQSRTRNTLRGWKPDGNIGFSWGLGDINDAVGVILRANIFGLSNTIGEDNNFGSGTMDVQITRNINDYIYVGAGVRNLWKWRSPLPTPRNNRSYFLVSNFILPIHREYEKSFSLLFFTAGIGNGMFRTDKNFDLSTSGKMSPFGSIALQVLRSTNTIVEWNGYELSVGISTYPFKKLPGLGGTIAVTDLTEKYQRLVVSVGYFAYLTNKK